MDASDRRRRASQEAAAWFVRLQTGELERADREEFVDWLRESAVHVAEMLRVTKVHDRLEEFQGWLQVALRETGDGGGDDKGDNDNVVSLPPHPEPASSSVYRSAMDGATLRNARRRFWLGAIAAGLAAVAVCGGVFFSPFMHGQTIETERGERRAVALPDGSVVDVDPETRVRVVFEERTRRVILEKGRALFRVAKNPARPFVVEANETTVRAVGTAFGVERQQDGVVVTVAEGKVAVLLKEAPTPGNQLPPPSDVEGAPRAGDADPTAIPSPSHPEEAGRTKPPNPSRHPEEIFLTAGQQVTLASAGAAEPVRTVDSDRELAWAKGQLVFDNETIAAAVGEFNRYNRVQLRVTDQALAARPVSGVFDASDPESFIGFLQTVTSVRVTRSESEIIMQ